MAPPDRHLVTCRLCFRPIDWSPAQLERGELHVYYRCSGCGGSFPVRHSDATVMTAEGHTSGATPA